MIQKLEEDVALLGSCLLSVPRPSQTHPSQQCMQPARFRNYAGNSPKGKQGKHPDTFATPCSDQHSVGKLPPRSSWAHLQATACSCSSQAVPSIDGQACSKIYMASLPIHLLTPEKSWEGKRYVLLIYGYVSSAFRLQTRQSHRTCSCFLATTHD